MKVLKCLNLNGMSIFQQLKYEELLLRHTFDNWFIYNTDSLERTIVLGFSGKIHELVNVKKAHSDSVNLIRRYTGGGTVIIDNNTIFTSFIMNTDDAVCKPYPRDIMTWSETIFGTVFNRKLGLEFSLLENDYVIGNKKIGGNAQSITKRRWVHHTSFLHSFNPKNMEYLLIPKKKPDYRVNRDHSSFLTTLDAYIESKHELELFILESLQDKYVTERISLDELESLCKELIVDKPLSSLVRTQQESYCEALQLTTINESLVKQGPSCVNV